MSLPKNKKKELPLTVLGANKLFCFSDSSFFSFPFISLYGDCTLFHIYGQHGGTQNFEMREESNGSLILIWEENHCGGGSPGCTKYEKRKARISKIGKKIILNYYLLNSPKDTTELNLQEIPKTGRRKEASCSSVD